MGLRPLAAFGLLYIFLLATCDLAARGLYIYLCAQLEVQERSSRPIGHKKRGRSPRVG